MNSPGSPHERSPGTCLEDGPPGLVSGDHPPFISHEVKGHLEGEQPTRSLGGNNDHHGY